MSIRLVLVDDHALFGAGVRGELADLASDIDHPELVIIGEAQDVAGAVATIRATRPDVVLLDVHLPAPSNPDLDVLATREQEVLRFIARGYTYKEIASRLHLSTKTIETHVSSVLRKLQLSNRHQLTAWANERRII